MLTTFMDMTFVCFMLLSVCCFYEAQLGPAVPRKRTVIRQEYYVLTSRVSWLSTSTQQESTHLLTAALTQLQVTRPSNFVAFSTNGISKPLGHISLLMPSIEELLSKTLQVTRTSSIVKDRTSCISTHLGHTSLLNSTKELLPRHFSSATLQTPQETASTSFISSRRGHKSLFKSTLEELTTHLSKSASIIKGSTKFISKQLGHTILLKSTVENMSTHLSSATSKTRQVTRTYTVVTGMTSFISTHLCHTSLLKSKEEQIPTHLSSATLQTPHETGSTSLISRRVGHASLLKSTMEILSTHLASATSKTLQVTRNSSIVTGPTSFNSTHLGHTSLLRSTEEQLPAHFSSTTLQTPQEKGSTSFISRRLVHASLLKSTMDELTTPSSKTSSIVKGSTRFISKQRGQAFLLKSTMQNLSTHLLSTTSKTPQVTRTSSIVTGPTSFISTHQGHTSPLRSTEEQLLTHFSSATLQTPQETVSTVLTSRRLGHASLLKSTVENVSTHLLSATSKTPQITTTSSIVTGPKSFISSHQGHTSPLRSTEEQLPAHFSSATLQTPQETRSTSFITRRLGILSPNLSSATSKTPQVTRTYTVVTGPPSFISTHLDHTALLKSTEEQIPTHISSATLQTPHETGSTSLISRRVGHASLLKSTMEMLSTHLSSAISKTLQVTRTSSIVTGPTSFNSTHLGHTSLLRSTEEQLPAHFSSTTLQTPQEKGSKSFISRRLGHASLLKLTTEQQPTHFSKTSSIVKGSSRFNCKQRGQTFLLKLTMQNLSTQLLSTTSKTPHITRTSSIVTGPTSFISTHLGHTSLIKSSNKQLPTHFSSAISQTPQETGSKSFFASRRGHTSLLKSTMEQLMTHFSKTASIMKGSTRLISKNLGHTFLLKSTMENLSKHLSSAISKTPQVTKTSTIVTGPTNFISTHLGHTSLPKSTMEQRPTLSSATLRTSQVTRTSALVTVSTSFTSKKLGYTSLLKTPQVTRIYTVVTGPTSFISTHQDHTSLLKSTKEQIPTHFSSGTLQTPYETVSTGFTSRQLGHASLLKSTMENLSAHLLSATSKTPQVTRTSTIVTGPRSVISKHLGHTSLLKSTMEQLLTHFSSTTQQKPQEKGSSSFISRRLGNTSLPESTMEQQSTRMSSTTSKTPQVTRTSTVVTSFISTHLGYTSLLKLTEEQLPTPFSPATLQPPQETGSTSFISSRRGHTSLLKSTMEQLTTHLSKTASIMKGSTRFISKQLRHTFLLKWTMENVSTHLSSTTSKTPQVTRTSTVVTGPTSFISTHLGHKSLVKLTEEQLPTHFSFATLQTPQETGSTSFISSRRGHTSLLKSNMEQLSMYLSSATSKTPQVTRTSTVVTDPTSFISTHLGHASLLKLTEEQLPAHFSSATLQTPQETGSKSLISRRLGHTSLLKSTMENLSTHLSSATLKTPQVRRNSSIVTGPTNFISIHLGHTYLPKATMEQRPTLFLATLQTPQVTRTSALVTDSTIFTSKELGYTSLLKSTMEQPSAQLPSAAMGTPQLIRTSKLNLFSAHATTYLSKKVISTTLLSYVNMDTGKQVSSVVTTKKFYFVLRLLVRSANFTLNYANTSSSLHKDLKETATSQVKNVLRGRPGFVSAEFKRFGPHSRRSVLESSAASLMTELLITYEKYYRNKLLEKLKKELHANPNLMFDPAYVETLHTFNSTCPPPVVKVSLNKTLDYAKLIFTKKRGPVDGREHLKFHAQVNHSFCSHALRSSMSWEVSKARLKSGVFISFLRRPLDVRKTTLRLYQERSSDSYVYISFVLRNAVDNRVIAYDYGYVLLLQPPPNANIVGVSRAVKGNGSVILNALAFGHSRARIPRLTYTWYCREMEERFPEDDSSLVDVPDGNSNTSGGCFGYGPGRLSGGDLFLNVDVNIMAAGQYVFKVKVKLDSIASEDSHHLTILEPTNFSVRCTYNCYPKVTISKRTSLETKCSGPVCQKIKRYQWTLYKTEKSNPDPFWIPVKRLKAKALSKLDGPDFVLRGKMNGTEYSLQPNTIYKAKVIAFIDEHMVIKDEIQFKTNSPPFTYSNGGCIISPSDGLALHTSFLVNCSKWHDDDLPLSFTFSYNSTKKLAVDIKRGSSLSSLTTILPQGDPSRDYNITVHVAIEDSLGATSHDIKVVTVRPFVITSSEILKKFIDGMSSALDQSLIGGDVGLAAETATLVLSSVEDGQMKAQEKKQVKDALLKKLSDVEVNDIQEVEQLSQFLTVATEEREDMSVSSLNNAVTLLGKVTDFLWTHVNNGSSYDRDAVNRVGEGVLKGMSNIMAISTTYKAADNKGIEFQKDVTENTLTLIDKLGTTLLSTKVVGEKPSTFTTTTLSMILDRQKPTLMGNRTLGTEQQERVILPSSETLFGNRSTLLSYVDALMLSLKQNPYTWDASSKDISSSVIKFELKTEEGSLMNIFNLKEPLGFFLPVMNQNKGEENDPKDHLFVKPGSDLQYHKVFIDSEERTVFVKLRPQKDTVFDVFVSSGIRPTERSHNFSKRIPDFSSCLTFDKRLGFLNCTRSPFEFFFSATSTGQTGIHFIGIRLANVTAIPLRTNLKVKTRKKKSCGGSTGRKKRSCVSVKDPPATSPPTAIVKPLYNRSTDVNYTMLVTLPECVHWSIRKQAWVKEGCKLGTRTTNERLHCLCNHLSAFGGSIFVSPNPIDFDKVFIEFTKLGASKNYVVLSTVCVIISLYFIGLAFARRADMNDKLKVLANVLLRDEEDESKRYRYNISIQTGMWHDFGTTAKVGMIILGKEGSSGVLSLNDLSISRKFFSRASVNNFTLPVQRSLGSLTSVCVWHDNSGPHPSWFLRYILITDVQTEEEWYFFANQWLSLDKGAGVTELYLKVAEGKELTAFKPLFITRVSRSLGEDHLWISVFTRPSHNPFTRCQRLSCCLSFLFAAMVTNAMFYQFDKPLTDTFKFGPLTMSWTQIKVGIQSSVVCIPINVLVVFIFQNIKQARSNDVFAVDENKIQSSGFLPGIFLYIAWALCFLISLTGAFFTILYSVQWGTDKSNQWLTSILVSVVQDVLISQPLKVVAFAMLLSLFIRKPPKIDDVMGPSFFKSKRQSKSNQPSPKYLERERKLSIKRRQVLEATKEIVTFVVFAFLLMIVSYGNLDVARYHMTKAVKDSFTGFEEVTNTTSLWEWLEGNLIAGLYDTTWYNGRLFKYEEGYVSNHEEFMLGMPRLRQLRLKPKQRCPGDALHFSDRFNNCRPTFSTLDQDRTTFYLPGWIPLTSHNITRNSYELCPRPWRYQSKERMESLQQPYDGEGYVALLGYNKKSALNVMRDLKEHGWIDESTAVVFIEFTLINPATSLFAVERYTFETQRTGGAVTSSEVSTLSLYPSTNPNFQSFYEVCQLVFLIIIVLCFIAEMVKLVQRGSQYLHHFWNWVELLFLLVCTVAVVASFLKGKYTSMYVKEVQENPYETFSPDYILRWSDQEIRWLAGAIFIITLKFLRIIRFNHHICQMQETIKRSARPLVSFGFVFGIGVVAFTYFGCISFGGQTSIFSSLFNSFKTNLLMSIGKQIDYLDIYLLNLHVELIFFFFYFVFILCVLLNVFIAVIADSYTEIREDHGEEFQDAQLGVFMFDNVARKVQQIHKEFKLGMKHISSVSCFNVTTNRTGHKKKSKPPSSTKPPDADENSKTRNELHVLISLLKGDSFSDTLQGRTRRIYTEAKVAEIYDIIDDSYLHEIRNQLTCILREAKGDLPDQ